MYYCYGKGVQKGILCTEVVPFPEGPLSEVLLYVLCLEVSMFSAVQHGLTTKVQSTMSRCINRNSRTL